MKKKQSKPKKAVIYARYSSHAQNDMSIEQQVQLCQELAKERNMTIVETYCDRAISGRSDKRPAFQKMMNDAVSGGFDTVISWKSSRIGRNMLEAMVNEARLAELEVRIAYVEENFADNAAGRFAARSMMNVNQFYSESMAEDIVRGLRSNAEQCIANGRMPLGYKKGADNRYEIDEPNAKIVKEIFNRVANGEPFVDIGNSLNARGIKTSYGNDWGKNSFHQILHNERYRGIYIYNDIRIEGGIPRIIDDELFFSVQQMTDRKPDAKGRHRMYGDYMLTGKLFCGECKSPMTGISGKGRHGEPHFYYACRKSRAHDGCKKKNVVRDAVEQAVGKAIRDNILQPDVIQWIADAVMDYQRDRKNNPELLLLKSQLTECQASIQNIMKAIEAGIFTATTKDRLQELEKQQANIQDEIEAAEFGMKDVPREFVIAWLESFRDGDVTDKKYLHNLFSSFLQAVYLYEDKTCKVVFDIGGGKTKTVDADILDGAGGGLFNASYSPPSESQTNPSITIIGGMFVLTFSLLQKSD